jgi:putative transposase
MKRATQVRLYPTTEQETFLNAQSGTVRFVYNNALHISHHLYQRHGISVSIKRDLKPLLASGKKSRRDSWLNEYDSLALQQAVINLDAALGYFFKKRARFPAFKRRHGKPSSYHPNGKVLRDAIQLPKMAPIKATLHRDITGKVSSITLSRGASGKYYAAVLCDNGLEAPAKPARITSINCLVRLLTKTRR